MGWCLFQYWKSITFASALLADESSESFIWACEAFKKKIETPPRCIVTDQCGAMKIAIEECFEGVKHRLCMWHIMKKFPAKVYSFHFIYDFCLCVRFKNHV